MEGVFYTGNTSATYGVEYLCLRDEDMGELVPKKGDYWGMTRRRWKQLVPPMIPTSLGAASNSISFSIPHGKWEEDPCSFVTFPSYFRISNTAVCEPHLRD
jgi:hypothetical protein